ncbi:hypothetical protein QU39_00265, partial [Staphylococcus aureus]
IDGIAEAQLVHHLEFGEADIDAIDPCKDPKQHQDRDQSNGDLPINRADMVSRARDGGTIGNTAHPWLHSPGDVGLWGRSSAPKL